VSTYPTVAAALRTAIAARPNLSAVTVRYGRPRYTEDLQSGNKREAVWIDGPGTGTKDYPYLTPGSKPTDETYTLLVAVQVEQGADAATDPDDAQLQADTRANALMLEVEAAVAADVTAGVTSVVPLVVSVNGWQRGDPPDASAESYWCRLDIEIGVQARIPAPS